MSTHVHGALRMALKALLRSATGNEGTANQEEARENVVIAIDGLISAKIAEALQRDRGSRAEARLIGSEGGR